MDEYVGIPQEYTESYHSFMFTNLFRHVNIDPKNMHILNGNPEDNGYAGECARYDAQIREAGGIELLLGGAESDGHIALNEPGSSLASRTRVPSMVMTVDVATITDAREVAILATGHGKAGSVQQAVKGGVGHTRTLSCLHMHACSMIVVDEDATFVKTVKYFKGVVHTTKQEAPKTHFGHRKKLQTLNTDVPVFGGDEGELTPDSMPRRITEPSPKILIVRSATLSFAQLGRK